MSLTERLLNIDRRYIYLVIAVAVLVPFILPFHMPVYVSQPVRSVYDFIEALPEGSVVLVGFNYSPSTMPELYPMSLAVLKHCCSRKLKIIGMTLYSSAATIGDTALKEMAESCSYQELQDYVYLGYKPNFEATMLGIGEDIADPFPTDYMNRPVTEISMMKNIKNYRDIALVIDLGSGNTPEAWIAYAGSRYGQKIASGCTGVMVSGLYPYLKAGQLVGLIGGLKGAAEYEKLVKLTGKATLGMNAQSMAHLAIIFLVLLGNVVYLISRHKARKKVKV
ncbi:hypothetical protein GF312_13315 [Candidatus Poribacteria bacterium]|nr:hypothetical protein [Candidatus Poribacteria bacterium]